MVRELWNEGRVVGYSAYELYVKQSLSEDPDSPIASEREWLASSIAMGSSMLLRLPTMEIEEDSHGYIDIPLPENSSLAAANTIIASFFDGDASFSAVSSEGKAETSGGGWATAETLDGGWATKVTEYSQLISNDDTSSPDSTVPVSILKDWDDTQKGRLRDYMRIVDGIVYQDGDWFEADNKPPQKDLKPDLTSSGHSTIRLHIKGPVSHQPRILFTGFTIRTVLKGVVGQDGSTDTPSPQDGDFLGPGIFPWANKIVFSVPTSYIVYFESGAYKRKINPDNPNPPYDEEAGDQDYIRVSDTPVIDMKSDSGDFTLEDYNPHSNSMFEHPVLEHYYDNYPYTDMAIESDKYLFGYSTGRDSMLAKKRSRIPDDVSDFTTLGDGTCVLTVYQKRYLYPPALYGTFVEKAGENYLHPVDVVAPGTIKMFQGDDNDDAVTNLMKDYQGNFEGTTAMNKTPDGDIQVLDKDGNKVPVATVDIEDIKYTGEHNPTWLEDDPDKTIIPKMSRIRTGKKQSLVVSLDDPENLVEIPDADPDADPDNPKKYKKYKNEVGYQVVIKTCPSNPGYLTGGSTRSIRPSGGPDVGGSNPISTLSSGDYVTWADLLEALANNQGLDILGERLRRAKRTLEGSKTEGFGPYLEFGPGIGSKILDRSVVDPDSADGKTVQYTIQALRSYLGVTSTEISNGQAIGINVNGTNITRSNLQMGDYVTCAVNKKYFVWNGNRWLDCITTNTSTQPLRLYICNAEPETNDVPVGSIGIGWGMS